MSSQHSERQRRKHRKIQSLINSTHYFTCTGFPFTQAPSSEKSSSHHSLTVGGKFSSPPPVYHALQLLFKRVRGNFVLNNENCFLFETFFRWRILSHNAGEIQILFSGTAGVERSNAALVMQMTHNAHNRNLMVFPSSWTVLNAIKLETTLFFGWCKNGSKSSSCSISWNNSANQNSAWNSVTSCLLPSRVTTRWSSKM